MQGHGDQQVDGMLREWVAQTMSHQVAHAPGEGSVVLVFDCVNNVLDGGVIDEIQCSTCEGEGGVGPKIIFPRDCRGGLQIG